MLEESKTEVSHVASKIGQLTINSMITNCSSLWSRLLVCGFIAILDLFRFQTRLQSFREGSTSREFKS